jgi:hypothetical protein
MSQERTRFPIQPKDVRRSAKSNKDVDVAGHGRRGDGGGSSDKPSLPPHRRHDEDPETEVATAETESAQAGDADVDTHPEAED